jgi:hypothetical protein
MAAARRSDTNVSELKKKPIARIEAKDACGRA